MVWLDPSPCAADSASPASRDGGACRPDLDVLPPLALSALHGRETKGPQLVSAVDERLAVVRKRKRDQAIAGQPASDLRKQQGILQRVGRRRGREGDRREAIGTLQGSQPTPRVKDRSVRVPRDELHPARIRKRIERVNDHMG